MHPADQLPDGTSDRRPPSRRERFRQETIEEIKDTARQQMANEGPAGLSLRAVARAMNITPSALYRYFEGFDDLVTSLCVDAYLALGDAVNDAVDEVDADDHIRRWRAYASAARRWALDNPANFALIYGTPLPGYEAPEEHTRPAARRFLGVPLHLVAAAVTAGAIDVERAHLQYEPSIGRSLLTTWTEAGVPLDPRTVGILVGAQVILQGHITYELFGHFNWMQDDPEFVWVNHLNAMMITMGFPAEQVSGLR